jgi:hypothetical protein
MPRYSILMPTHNRADVVGFAIRSVLAQTEPDFELLIVGDGCTDSTADVVQGFTDDRIRWFDLPKAPNFGYANRNIALREARGKLIAFAAHDDLLFFDHLALFADVLERTGADWAYSRPLFVSIDGVVLPFGTNLNRDDDRRFFLEQSNTIPASCVVHRRDCFDRFGYWPEGITHAGDWWLWKHMINSGARISYLDMPTTLHFTAIWREGRISRAPYESTMLAIADEASWWPESLHVKVPEGSAEQAVFFDCMERSGSSWREAIRADVQFAFDRIAWDYVRSGGPSLVAARDRVASLEKALAEQTSRAVSSEAEVAELTKKASAIAARTTALSTKLEVRRNRLRRLRKRHRAIRSKRSTGASILFGAPRRK